MAHAKIYLVIFQFLLAANHSTQGFQCFKDQFPCGNNTCIPQNWRCDGDADCADGSDEQNCPETSCDPRSFFKCKDSVRCIPKRWVCDSDDDCGDNSDEQNCNFNCSANLFTCNNGRCIDNSKVCDGNDDCSDRSDELKCRVNECLNYNGHCQQICNDTKTSYFCSCRPGYEVDKEDRRGCQDVDECKIPGICSQVCYNIKGSFKCMCRSGYNLEPDRRSCKAIGGDRFLIFANRHDIRRLAFSSSYSAEMVPDQKGAVALDFDFNSGYIFWTDVIEEEIRRAKMEENPKVEVVANISVDTPNGIAVDWINKKLYWTDTGNDTIEVADFDGTNRLQLIKTRLQEPRAIVVHPFIGYMYWSDLGETPKIERCGLNGDLRTRKVIINTSILWPNALTIDYTIDKIWWADAKMHTIESANFLGRDRRVILRESINHPFALTLFQKYMYWTDREHGNGSINRANKFNGKERVVMQESLYDPMDIHVFHKQRQPIEENPCRVAEHYGGCSHICLLAPKPFYPDRFSCHCPPGINLLYDSKTCNTTGAPSIDYTDPPLESATKENVTLTCHARGLPEPTFTWITPHGTLVNATAPVRKIAEKLDDDSEVFTGKELQEDGSLLVYYTRVDDQGVYKCVVTNDLGQAVGNVSLTVREDILEVRAVVTLEEEVFDEELESKTSPRYQEMERNVKQQLTVLFQNITGFQRIDILGFYNGSVKVRFRVVVKVDKQEEKPAEVVTKVGETLRDNVKKGKIGSLKVKDTLEMEEVPPPPVNVQYSDVKQTEARITWSHPELYEVYAISSYLLQVKKFGTKTWTQFADTRGDNHRLTNLEQGTPYIVRLKSVNKFGRGDPSETLELQTEESLHTPNGLQKNHSLTYILSIVGGVMALCGLVIAIILYRRRTQRRRYQRFELKDREDFQYDIFVTFSTLDYPWVRDNLVPLLERRQINYCIHSRDFVIGKAILENMADSVYNSRKVLAVISENYLASKFCRQELDMALYRSVSVAPNPSLLLIRVDDVDKKKLPKSLQKQTFLDYTSAVERNKWEERLLKHIVISFVKKDENLLASEILTSV